MLRGIVRMIVNAVAATALATPALAQGPQPAQPGPAAQQPGTTGQRPYRGLFGGGVGNTSQSLVLNVSFGGAYFEDLTDPVTTTTTGDSTSPASPALADPSPRSREYAIGALDLGYAISRDRIWASLSASAQGRYASGRARVSSGTYRANGQAGISLTTSTRLSISYGTGLLLRNRATFNGNQIGLLADPGVSLDPTAFIDRASFRNSHATANFSQSLTQRLSVNVGYGYHTNNAWASAGRGRYSVQHANGGISYRLGGGLGAHFSYGLTKSQFAGSTTPGGYRGRTLDGGLTFNQRLSISRRATLSFSTGASGLSNEAGTTRYHATGHVGFGYELGRSWTLGVTYRRAASFDESLGQPTLRDVLSTSVDGILGRRFHAYVGAKLLRGNVSLQSRSNYSAASADVGVQFGLSRELAVNTNYTFYQHDFNISSPLPPGLSSTTQGQTLRVSLRLWVPLLLRTRRP